MLFYLVLPDIKYRPSHGNGAGRDQTFLLYDARQNILHQQKYFDNSWQHVSCTTQQGWHQYDITIIFGLKITLVVELDHFVIQMKMSFL